MEYVNKRMFFGFLFAGLVPTLYTTFRIYLLGTLPDASAYSIAGQLSWVSLLYEILDEAILLPMFFVLGETSGSSYLFSGRLKTVLVTSGIIYAVFSALVYINAEPLLGLMAVSPELIEESAAYIRLECIANFAGLLFRVMFISMQMMTASGFIVIITLTRLVLTAGLDAFFISDLPFSLTLGVNGIGFSNIAANSLLFILAVFMQAKAGINIFDREAKFDFRNVLAHVPKNFLSGLESLIRNAAYIFMISRMVNIVGEQGTYWVANSFIWGWLLLPVTALGELIKRDTAIMEDTFAVEFNTRGYLAMTGIICAVWLAAIPLYKPFMRNVLGYADTEKVFSLVLLLLGFYILYALQNVFDSVFYGTGEIKYMLWESVITNTVYYGGAFIAYLMNRWTPSLTGIALLFGIGLAFDTLVSWIAFKLYLKRNKLKLL